ncbi:MULTISPECIES: hypothetical protein [unclassified Streptomyces]|uniref:Lipoprotein n=1 Tax=Streptomyces niveiscabiei TaxID=164115 RepID=A0ABW9HZF8_9ACTN|nr:MULTISPECIES: hypothetical protein [unclassified Streptomyces]
MASVGLRGAGVVVGAVLLAGCGGGGGDSSSPSPEPSTASATASPSPSASATPLAGSWLGTAGGQAVVLMIEGGKASLYATGGTVCNGTAGEEAGMRMIHLTCPTGKKDRTTGMVDSVDAEKLVVTWTGSVGKETYTKADGSVLPSGVPTGGLG